MDGLYLIGNLTGQMQVIICSIEKISLFLNLSISALDLVSMTHFGLLGC